MKKCIYLLSVYYVISGYQSSGSLAGLILLFKILLYSLCHSAVGRTGLEIVQMALLAGRKISALMLDLSGTVHVGDQLLPGVSEAVSLVRGLGLPIQFVTNTSKESLTSLTERVRRAGLEVEQDSIFTSLTAARDLGN